MWKQTQGALRDEWRNKIWHRHNGISFDHKKERTPVICNNTDALSEYYPKQNKSNRERQILYDLTQVSNLKKKTGLIEKESRLMAAGKGKLGEDGQRHKLLVIRQVSSGIECAAW